MGLKSAVLWTMNVMSQALHLLIFFPVKISGIFYFSVLEDFNIQNSSFSGYRGS